MNNGINNTNTNTNSGSITDVVNKVQEDNNTRVTIKVNKTENKIVDITTTKPEETKPIENKDTNINTNTNTETKVEETKEDNKVNPVAVTVGVVGGAGVVGLGIYEALKRRGLRKRK